jgi:multicomponent Na+:H+ antiporter subunit C
MLEIYVTFVVMTAVSIYCIACKGNLIKKLLGLGILTDAIHLLIISTTFRENGIAPIITPGNINLFSSFSVDPLPQALVLTSIVINLSTTALALALAVAAYRRFKTLDTEKMRTLEG